MAAGSLDAAIAARLSAHSGSSQLTAIMQGGLASTSTEGARSALCDRLLHLGALGVLSWNLVRWVAEGGVIDGINKGSLSKVASAGSNGKYPANCRRDILTTFCRKSVIPKPISAELPMAYKHGLIEWKGHHFVDPTAILEVMYQNRPAMFPNWVGANFESFWDALKPDDPKLIPL